MEHMSTLCYIEKDGRYLMLHRTVKKHDVNKDKWIGVGGHFEEGESPEECVLREVKEETGYTLTSYQYRGLVTFISGDGVTEYMSLFTADQFTGEEIPVMRENWNGCRKKRSGDFIYGKATRSFSACWMRRFRFFL